MNKSRFEKILGFLSKLGPPKNNFEIIIKPNQQTNTDNKNQPNQETTKIKTTTPTRWT